MAVRPRPHRFSAEDYHRMGATGILSEGDRVELIEGEIVEMTPIGSSHQSVVDRLTAAMIAAVGDAAIVRVQGPVRLDEYSEPQPDLSLLRPRADFYAEAHPGPADVLLLVEVAETSTPTDRAVKLPLYARAGIPEAWLIDLRRERVDVCRSPSSEGYRDVRSVPPGDDMTVAALPHARLAVASFLG